MNQHEPADRDETTFEAESHPEQTPESRRVSAPDRRTSSAPPKILAGDWAEMQERVQQSYGAFGVRNAAGASRSTVAVGETHWRETLSLIAGVLLASAFLAFASHPTFDGPSSWRSSVRLDSLFVVVWGPLLAWAIVRRKLAASVRTYLVLALFIEAFSEAMFKAKGEGGYWDSILWPAAVAFYGTLKEFAGIPGASLPVFFLVTLALLARSVRRPLENAPPRFAKQALLVFLGAVVALTVLGIARGGQVDFAFRQVLHLVQLPLVALVFLYALRIPEDLPAIGTVFVLTAFVRSLLVVWVYVGVCIPQGITALPGKPEWCTTHSDSVLFVSALVILIAHVVEQRKARVRKRSLGIGLVIFLGILLNNRRLAFVSLGIAPLAIYLALDASRRKRNVAIAIAIAAPILAGYVLLGSDASSTSAFWKPARSVASVLDQKDTSSISRDIENENLIYTLRKSPLAPTGFGHEYDFSPSNPPVDLSDVFKNYRLIAHNGVLWLWSIAGVVGFAFLWFLYPLAGTLALRGYRGASSPIERSAALAALGCTAVVVVQVWGDQGINSYLTLVTFGVCYAVASRLAVQTR